jgi:DNA-binding transcriptional LysR family regulator
MDKVFAMGILVRIVERGSFSEVARELSLAPSSVARQVTLLEESLGAQLVNRTTRQLQLTEAGREYYDRASRILREIEEADQAVSQFHRAPRGTLHVTAPQTFSRFLVVPMIPSFLERYPEVKVQLTACDRFVDLVADRVDVAIRIGGLRNSTYIVRKLMEIKRYVVASPAYLERHGVPEKPEDLARHNCLAFRVQPTQATSWRFRDGDLDQIVPVHGNFVSNSALDVLTGAADGLGIAILPSYIVSSYLEDGSLRRLYADYEVQPSHLGSTVYAVYPGTRTLAAKTRVFIDFLVDAYARLAEPRARIDELLDVTAAAR